MPSKKQVVSPRIAEPDFFTMYFPNLNNGCQFFLDAAPNLFRQALIALKGQFTEGELKLLIEAHNGYSPMAGAVGQRLYGKVEDGMALDRLHEKWGVDRTEMLNKIRRLGVFERAVLEIWAWAFWHGGWKQERPELGVEDADMWIKKLLREGG